MELALRTTNGREMKDEDDKVELVTNALRDALIAYEKLDGPDNALVIVALFGVTQSKRLLPKRYGSYMPGAGIAVNPQSTALR